MRMPETLKIAGAFALVGGLGYFVTLLLHGDLPDATTEIALNHIAARPEWPFLKLALVTWIMLWVGAFTGLTSSCRGGASALLARTATHALLIGAAIVAVEYSILGYEVKRIANAWQVASGDERQHPHAVAEVLFSASGGLFVSFISW